MGKAIWSKENVMVQLLTRSGVSSKTIDKIVGVQVDEAGKLPLIADVKVKRGRGKILQVLFDDGSLRDVNVVGLPEEKFGALLDRGYLRSFQFDSQGIWWETDKKVMFTIRDIFAHGKNIFDPVVEKIKNKGDMI